MFVPDKHYWYWRGSGLCVECNQPLRHYLHLVNHYFKWHAPQPYVLDKLKPREERQRFYVWSPANRQWKEVSRDAYIWGQGDRTKCFAMTKQQSKRSAANEQPKKKQRHSVHSSSSRMPGLWDHLESRSE